MLYKIVSSNYKDFILNIDKYFLNSENVTLFDKRNIIKIIEFNDAKYVVKSFKIPHFINKIVYRFIRSSKAKRSYDNSVKLQSLGVNTPKPIGFVEFSSLIFFGKSFYVCEYFNYDFEIRAVFKDKEFDDRLSILKDFIKFTKSLHDKGVYHIDYSPGNILIKKVDDEYQFFIIDVNRMKFMEFDNALRMKSLSKLTLDKDDNRLMSDYYANILNINHEELYKILDFYIDEQKRYLDNKKRFKKVRGIKVVD